MSNGVSNAGSNAGSDLDSAASSIQTDTMPRSPRLFVPGLLYHVFSRGNNKQTIFTNHSDFQRFSQNITRFHKHLDFKLYAYCLLPNHFHLLIESPLTPISKIMQTILTSYTMYFNKRYDSVGHLFQGRFKSIIVDKDEYLLQVSRYIHLNPVKAGLTSDPMEYPWSSYRLYWDNQNELIDTQPVLSLISNSTSKDTQLANLRKFTIEGLTDDFDPEILSVRGVLGNPKLSQYLTRVSKGVRP